MGITDNENPVGLMPFLSPGIPIGGRRRRKRADEDEDEDEEEEKWSEPVVAPHLGAGGERQDKTAWL